MTQETLLQRTEGAVALVRVLRSERDQALARLMLTQAQEDHALAELTTSRAERDQALAKLTVSEAEMDRIRPIPAKVRSNVAETSGSTQFAQKPENAEHQLELEECRKALLQTQADLEHTKDELKRAEVRLRTQTMKMRQQAANTSGQN